MKRTIILLAIFLSLLQPAVAGPSETAVAAMRATESVEKFIRTELYFGRNIPTGGTVSESDWQKFVDEFVTPRFPDGLTVLDADGQWRGKDGSIAREESKVIVLLYSRKERKAKDLKIEEIRSEYKKRFKQEAVMRIDITKSVEVSF